MIREAAHAGSWYPSSRVKLANEIDKLFSRVDDSRKFVTTKEKVEADGDLQKDSSATISLPSSLTTLKAIIAPHAGYSYSGFTAAFAYKPLINALARRRDGPNSGFLVRRVFLLGPSHHVYLRNCGLSGCRELQTPLGSFLVDTKTVQNMKKDSTNSSLFDVLDLEDDEAEHSVEMHLPLLAQCCKHAKRKCLFESGTNLESEPDLKLIPILVGDIFRSQNEKAKKIESDCIDLFAKYLLEPDTLFIVSSDFCHWGSCFRYQRILPGYGPSKDQKNGSITDSITKMDYDGIHLIEQCDTVGWMKYLHQTKNTICGRNPISLLLHSLERSTKAKMTTVVKKPMSKEGGEKTKRRKTKQDDSQSILCQTCASSDVMKLYSIRFLKYAQSAECATMRDSSVSYASAVILQKNF